MSDAANSKDTTLKVRTETRDEVNALLIEKNLSSANDGIEYLLGEHRIAKELSGPDKIPELESLDYFFSRIKNTYIEMFMVSKDKAAQASQEKLTIEEELQQTKLQLIRMAEEKNLMQIEVTNADNTAKSEIEKVKGEAALTSQTINKEIDQMQKLMTQANESKEQSAQLVILAQEAAKHAKDRADTYEEKANKADLLQQEIIRLNDDNKKSLEEIQQLRADKIRDKEQAEMSKDRALLDAERGYMAKLHETIEALSAAKDEIANLKIQAGTKK